MNDEFDDVAGTCNWNYKYIFMTFSRCELFVIFRMMRNKAILKYALKELFSLVNSTFYIFDKIFMEWQTASSKSYCEHYFFSLSTKMNSVNANWIRSLIKYNIPQWNLKLIHIYSEQPMKELLVQIYSDDVMRRYSHWWNVPNWIES